MAKLQKWSVDIEGEVHTVAYRKRSLFRKAKITIDEFTFPLVSVKLFSSHREVFRLGDKQAILEVAKNGKASIILDSDKLVESK